MTAEAERRQQVIEAIHAAFPSVPLDPTSAFREYGATYLDVDSSVLSTSLCASVTLLIVGVYWLSSNAN